VTDNPRAFAPEHRASASPRREITVTVNGEERTATVEHRSTLAYFLREDCGLTGTHLACEHGVCGACTVLLDGAAVRSCLLFAVQLDGARVTTVEGLSPEDGSLSAVQQSFADHHGLQCGFCTPGFVMSVSAFLAPTRATKTFSPDYPATCAAVPVTRGSSLR
jgi:aerobic carbon-monoxide dehydrogenase small subunit